jgi:hypothetical protein
LSKLLPLWWCPCFVPLKITLGLYRSVVLLILGGFCFWTLPGYSQIHNEQRKTWYVTQDSLILDTVSILPGSVLLWNADTLIHFQWWHIDYARAIVHIDPPFRGQTVQIQYKTLPYNFTTAIANKDRRLIASKKDSPYRPYIIGGGRNNLLANDESIHKSGSISRGVTVGNAQNLAVNSTLNLQLTGKITERYELLASISDDNIPIQPEGNTGQLQDFDQVFIQISDSKSRLIAGDFIIQKPMGYYLNYNKRAQGLYYLNKWDQNKGTIFRLESSISVSKGRFGRNVITGVEGNQGPYRLTGSDGEQFIIVLGGTEQVYLDGRLLQRGLDKDYVIDYNAAEITFTPRHLITKDRRITVEFQYSEKRYARPLLQTSMQWQRKEHLAYFNVYSEGDAKNQPLQQDLSDEDKLLLSLAGDDPLLALSNGVVEVPYSNSQVLYAQIDSLGFQAVLVYSTDSANARYRASFSLVGAGNGDYIEDGFAAAGKKYKWVAPTNDNGNWVHQGNYAPVLILVAPKKNQMLTAGYEWHKINRWGAQSRSHNLKTEGAFSYKDLNTFSSKDNGNNTGFTGKLVYQLKRTRVDSLSTLPYERSVYGQGSYEYNHENFNSIERFREVEFNRNWNFGTQQPTGALQLLSMDWGWNHSQKGNMQLGSQYLQLKGWGEALKSQVNLARKSTSGFSILLNGSYLQSKGATTSQFIRHKASLSQTWRTIRVYYKDEHERNTIFGTNTNQLSPLSYQFYDWEAGFGTADTNQKSLTVYYRNRFENRLNEDRLSRASVADQYGVVARWNTSAQSRLALFVSNRRLRITNPEAVTTAPENTLVTRLEYNWKHPSGFLQSTTYYESGSGLEQRKEYIYLEVQPGQGNFVWVDYNNNSIKELNEFEVAIYAYEANYIRSAIQSNAYVRTYSNEMIQSLHIQPEKLIKQKKGWRKALALMAIQSTMRFDRKNNSEGLNERFNPIGAAIEDSTLLMLNGVMRHALFINKSNPRFSAELIYQENTAKNLLSNGFEIRADEYFQGGLRWTFKQTWTLSSESKTGSKAARSDFLSGRNYQIAYLQTQPVISWQPGTKSRFNIKTQFTKKANSQGIEKAIIQKVGAEILLSDVQKGSIQCELNYFKIAYMGATNTSLAFEMLEGLSQGNNFTWTVNVQRTIAKNLQLNLTYNGRKPEEIPTIHSGGMQLRAFF